MKNFILLLAMVLLQACNSPVKTPDATSEPTKEHLSNVCTPATAAADTVHPVYSAEDEVRIKKDSLLRVHKSFPFIKKYTFEKYKAPLFSGVPAAPDFKGNPYADDPEYVAFITEGCKQGINFGGHYTLIEKGCGMMCEHLFMVDRSNGKIFTHTTGLKKEDGYYGFKFEKGSYLLITNATILIDASMGEPNQFSIKPEIFKWKNNKFIRLE